MKWAKILGFLFFLFVLLSLGIYWIVPFNNSDFLLTSSNSNFSLGGIDKLNLTNYSTSMQFYPNMRFPTTDISYKIDSSCPLGKKYNMQQAFRRIENVTALNFYPVNSNQQISITCDSRNMFDRESDTFIAGEGGPTNITRTNNFNVIFSGQVLLIRDSQCTKPNIATHELLHVLGFKHSKNPNNIMYPYTKCRQTLGEDIPNLINELYSFPSYPDLSFENVSAKLHGRFLDTNIIIRNNGLSNSGIAVINIYADGKIIKSFNINPLDIGDGRITKIQNIFVTRLNVKELEFEISTSFNELDKKNNKIKLEIKN